MDDKSPIQHIIELLRLHFMNGELGQGNQRASERIMGRNQTGTFLIVDVVFVAYKMAYTLAFFLLLFGERDTYRRGNSSYLAL